MIYDTRCLGISEGGAGSLQTAWDRVDREKESSKEASTELCGKKGHGNFSPSILELLMAIKILIFS